MSTLTNLCMISFLLLIVAQASARSGAVFTDVTYVPTKMNNKVDEVPNVAEVAKVSSTDENFDICSGVGEEECLMRRTLAAHIDYIYTQGNKHN